MMGLKDVFVGRDGRNIKYEFVFENENLAKTAKELMKQNINQMIPLGMDKLAEEIEIEQEGNKLIQTFKMKNEKIAECLFYLMKEIQGEQT